MAGSPANKARILFPASGKIHLYQALEQGGAPQIISVPSAKSIIYSDRHLIVSTRGLSLLSCDLIRPWPVVSNRHQSFPRILHPRIVASRLCKVFYDAKRRRSNGPVMLLICDVSSRGFAYVHSLDDIGLSPSSRLRHALTRGIQRSSPLLQHSDLWAVAFAPVLDHRSQDWTLFLPRLLFFKSRNPFEGVKPML
jgi:hypothetical protein